MKSTLKLLVVANEPTPYNVDLHNAFYDTVFWVPYVIYQKVKDYSTDAGHDYKDLPFQKYAFRLNKGGDVFSIIRSFIEFLKIYLSFRPDLLLVSGYNEYLSIFVIIFCTIIGRNFIVRGDAYHSIRKRGFFAIIIGSIVRAIVFSKAKYVMGCGVKGVESALLAGCASEKVLDFPYSVDVMRYKSVSDEYLPCVCAEDILRRQKIILFSGRLIKRKGLDNLLCALSSLEEKNYILWVEGDGPLRLEYEQKVLDMKLSERCRFLGFCQMNVHASLLNNADLIVVPSLNDPWGIVVDEGMQLGKLVVASDKTGSAIDRIKSGENGFIYKHDDCNQLCSILRDVIQNCGDLSLLKLNALKTAEQYSPRSLVTNLYEIYSRRYLDKDV